jgi:cytochrome P450
MRNEDEIAGVILLKGINVATCIYPIHRNPAYFTDRNKFRLDWWLEEFQGDGQANLAKRAFVPFSLGSRSCIGKNLAYMEMSVLLALIMYKADWMVPEGAVLL